MKTLLLNIIRLLSIVFGFTVLAGCSSNGNLTSSFSQRKYTKGYFDNAVGEKHLVIAKSTNKSIVTHAISTIQSTVPESALRLKDVVNSASVKSLKQKGLTRNIPAITAPYKNITEVSDSTKTKDIPVQKKDKSLRHFLIMNWFGIYAYTVIILGLLTLATTGIAYTIINIAFFTLLIPVAICFLGILCLAIYCGVTGKHFW